MVTTEGNVSNPAKGASNSLAALTHVKAVRKMTTLSKEKNDNENNNKIAEKPHHQIEEKSRDEPKEVLEKENPVTYLVPPVQANNNHDLVCKNCFEAFEYQSYLRDHLKSKQCANISCKEDHDHLNQTVCNPYLDRDDAIIFLQIICSVNMYNHNDDRNQHICKQATTPKKCTSRFAIRKGHRYLQDGKFVKVWVVVGCKVHTHGPYMKVRQFCDLEHEHHLVDQIIENRADGEAYAKELLDHDYKFRDRKKENYIKFDCAVPECGIYLKVNYKDEKNVHIRGCLKHTHEPRNVRRDLKCYTDHDHEILEKTFDSLAEAMAFIYGNKFDAQFNIQKNYSNQKKVHKVFQCARKGRYLAKIDTKKNKGKKMNLGSPSVYSSDIRNQCFSFIHCILLCCATSLQHISYNTAFQKFSVKNYLLPPK